MDDFDSTYPDKANGLFDTLHTCRANIVKLANTIDGPRSEMVKELLAAAGDNLSSSEQNILSLMLIPLVISPPAGKKGKGNPCIKPSIIEQRDAFLYKLDNESSLPDEITERRKTLAELKLTLQPWIVYVGNFLTPTKVFIIVDDIIYTVDSIVTAVDITFKIFYSTHAEYTAHCFNIWLFIQLGFYNLKTKFDGKFNTIVNALLKDLDLPKSS